MKSRCLLLVHAHPDDESIFTGATMAKYAAEGARVTLVTCTRGERGSIPRTHPAAQAGDRPRGESRLAEVGSLRAKELEAACTELGVTEQWYLGGPGRWRDSGPGRRDDPRAFCHAELDEATGELAALIHKAQPQVMVTYDANGFYGHPDHIQAHRVAWRAYQQTCDPLRTKFYALTIPRSVLADAINDARRSRPDGRHQVEVGGAARILAAPDTFLQFGVPDDQVTAEIRADSFLDVKIAALKAHATQIMVDDRFFHAAGLVRMRVLSTEYYTLLSHSGAVPTGPDGQGRENDLFCGI
jgi:N-acetyl-1-D-myo-inositol-2-amino-2-deoxy-alpha-D-glucopyranoside deacetylase